MERKMRVIVFEDDQDIGQLIEQFLKDKGYEVYMYQDPSQCPLQHSHDCQCSEKETCADVVITDIDMPHVSGFDFIEGQVSKGCKIRNMAVMSGRWSEISAKRAESLGCTVFKKPFSLSLFAEWLDMCEDRLDRSKNLSNWFLDETYNHSGSSE